MNQNHHLGAQWTARRVAFLCVLLALMTGIQGANRQSLPAYLPPAPLAPDAKLVMGPPAPGNPDPADPAAQAAQAAQEVQEAQAAQEVQAAQEALGQELQVSAAAGCTRAFCSYIPVVRSAAQTTGPSSSSRTEAVNLFRQKYLPAESATPTWNGNVAACSAGQTSQAFRDAVLARLNYFRVMAGIPALQGLDSVFNNLDQQAALIMSANNQLSHSPPNSWRCYSQAGSDGAGSSNLALGLYGPNAITGYMRDPGAGNLAAGHRRWILYPQSKRLGTGDIPASGGYSYANALRSWDENFGGPRPATRDGFVAWPPPGYVPYPVVFARWSFAYPNANFDSAQVSVTRRGASVPVSKYAPVNGFGENTLVWLVNNMADGAEWPRPSADDPYVVTVRNVIVDGRAKDFSYTVTIIDPQ